MLVLALSVVVLGGCTQSYDSMRDLQRAQEDGGWRVIGTFGGTGWPAKVVEERTELDGITFLRLDGTSHTYSGYTGYQLRLVRLAAADGRETILVLRAGEPQ